MTTSNVTCVTCSKSGPKDDLQSWHPFMHPLNTGDGSVGNIFSKKSQDGAPVQDPGAQVVHSSLPFDPVLRQALIDKGVLTVDDLANAELKIRTISGMIPGTMPTT